uniref:Tocopherol O-methyltransferase, chloroplastic isoform X1 n=1 Tax=Nicotiana tabacum TaxID=4097 RepID=A0A1S4BJT9_TOBAC|nr:PREDICTED: tocopherol O-methyltransferase, chloroplastic-like isoform X1 [Nicotiana tabacum]XP_016489195.1 PREDICTED: tocopherol O-methyltransferase, chloroplastic-like isoform X2 [Nicotiana tabacum]
MSSTCYSASSIQSLNPTCPSSLIFTLHKPQLLQIHSIKETKRTRTVRTYNSNTRTRRRMTSVAAMNAVSTPEVDVQNQQELKKGIAELYDESSGIWEDIWGDHMHHGFYEPQSSVSLSDHRAAQIRMIEEALRFASVSDDPAKKPRSIVDVGCGIGGSSRYLAKKYGATAQGITLSPVQAERAQALAAAQGLGDKASFQVADALNQPFPDGQFDLVWSMESGEHMPDKQKFVGELARVAAPGGTIILVTWCHRDLSPSEESLLPEEKELLNKICKSFYLPAWCSTADYVKLLQSNSLRDIKAADWSENVAPFWPAVIKSALTWKGFTSILRSGWKTIKAALAMPLMIEGYKKGLIKFAIITCRKPE